MKASDLLPDDLQKNNDIIVTGSKVQIDDFCKLLDDLGYRANPLDMHDDYDGKEPWAVVVCLIGSYARMYNRNTYKLRTFDLGHDHTGIFQALHEVDIQADENIRAVDSVHAVSVIAALIQGYVTIEKCRDAIKERANPTNILSGILHLTTGISEEEIMEVERRYNSYKSVPIVLTQTIVDNLKKYDPAYTKIALDGNVDGENDDVRVSIAQLRDSFGPYEDNSGNIAWSIYYSGVGFPSTYCHTHEQYHYGEKFVTKHQIAADIDSGKAYISTVVNSQDKAMSINSPVVVHGFHGGIIKKFEMNNGLLEALVEHTDSYDHYDVTVIEPADWATEDFCGNHLEYGQHLWTVNLYDSVTTQPNAGFINADGHTYLERDEAKRFNPIIRQVYLFANKKDMQYFLDVRLSLICVEDILKHVQLTSDQIKALIATAKERERIMDETDKARGVE